MKKVLKYTSYSLLAIAGILFVVYLVFSFRTNAAMNEAYLIEPENLPVLIDSAAIARGKHIVESRGCTDCHGASLEGRVFIDDFAMGKVIATNLTGGKGGVQKSYSDADWVRAIRHGIHRSGRPLLIMPSNEYFYLGDEDLAGVIAYLKSLPPIDNPLPANNIGPLARVLYPLGKLEQLIPAKMIDHQARRPVTPAAAVTPEYGEYVAVSCQGCHYPNMEGGPSAVPGYPPAPDLTRNGSLARWTEADFIQAMRSGKTVDGKELNNAYMPWQVFGKMNETELRAIWAYLQTLPKSDSPHLSSSSN